MKKTNIKKLALSALFVAVITACSWISIPTPFGVNMTLSIFGVCLSALVLGCRYAFCTVSVYILSGIVGMPVFSSFSGGAGVLFGISGGFLWGFLLCTVLCGFAKKSNTGFAKHILVITSVLICHAFGVAQFCFVSGNGVLTGFITASLPFLIKDIALAILAVFVAKKLALKIEI